LGGRRMVRRIFLSLVMDHIRFLAGSRFLFVIVSGAAR
jgi:hypothetical protein